MALRIESRKEGAEMRAALAGALDEETSLSGLSAQDCADMTVDLEGLTAINSIGIREWIRWVKGLGAVKLRVRACPRVFVDQINMVAGMLPEGAIVESFYVPYHCEEQDAEIAVLWTRGVQYGGGKVLDEAETWNGNGRRYLIDVEPRRYFAFVRRFG